jgi:chromosome segregation ATPase
METSGTKVDKRKKVKLSDGTETTLAAENNKIKKADSEIQTQTTEIAGFDESLNNQSAALKKFTNDLTTAEGKIIGYNAVVAQSREKVASLQQAFESGSVE